MRGLPCVTTIFFGLSIFFSIFTILRIILNFHLLDFGAYYTAVDKIVNHQNPYITSSGEMAFIYPPTALLFLIPIKLFPYQLAEDIWTLASFAAFSLALYLLVKAVLKNVPVVIFLLLYSFSVLAFPIKFTMGMGQINMFILLLLSLVFYFYLAEKDALVAFLLAAAVAVKLTPAVLFFFFLRKGKWKLTVNTIFFLLLMQWVATVVFRQNLTDYYFSRVFPNIPTINNASYYNQALTGFLARLNTPTSLAYFINYSTLIGLLIASFFVIPTRTVKPHLELIQFGLWIVIVLVAGGLTWQHHLVLLLIPYIGIVLSILEEMKLPQPHRQGIWLAENMKHISKTNYLIFLLSYFLFAINIKQPNLFISGPLVFVLSHGLYAMFLILVLLLKVSMDFPTERRRR